MSDNIDKYDLQKYILNFVRQFGLIKHNITSFDKLVMDEGLGKVLQSDFNKEYYIEIHSKNSNVK